MAKKLTTATQLEERERLLLLEAVGVVRHNAALRFFIRRILANANHQASCYTGEAISTAFELGRQAVGLDLIALLAESDPLLYPTLLIEEQNDVPTDDE